MGAATTNLPTAAAALKALDLPGATAAMRTECAGRVACTGWNNSLRFTPRSVGMAANLTKPAGSALTWGFGVDIQRVLAVVLRGAGECSGDRTC